jgi:hypothetical protein
MTAQFTPVRQDEPANRPFKGVAPADTPKVNRAAVGTLRGQDFHLLFADSQPLVCGAAVRQPTPGWPVVKVLRADCFFKAAAARSSLQVRA